MIKINLTNSKLINSDCLAAMKELPNCSVDSIVTDPPYGISFMGKKWDYDVPSKEVFAEMLRVLKPGGHALIACGTRTQHRMAVNIEDAGFEIRDVITWLYGSGFPKSMDISKAIDKQAGVNIETSYLPQASNEIYGNGKGKAAGVDRTPGTKLSGKAKTDAAKQWQGWGTALKPACEFWTLARKPLSEKTVAQNVLTHGTGGLNIDGCRVETSDEIKSTPNNNIKGNSYGSDTSEKERDSVYTQNPQGRWPANLILDEEAAKLLDEQVGKTSKGGKPVNVDATKSMLGIGTNSTFYGNDGSNASRFFYVAKASKSERNKGLSHLPKKEVHRYGSGLGEGLDPDAPSIDSNFHPTVKPIKLMTYLCRLITPPNGVVLDPFMGSGSTGVAAVKEGFGFIGIERESAYFEICKARIEGAND